MTPSLGPEPARAGNFRANELGKDDEGDEAQNVGEDVSHDFSIEKARKPWFPSRIEMESWEISQLLGGDEPFVHVIP